MQIVSGMRQIQALFFWHFLEFFQNFKSFFFFFFFTEWKILYIYGTLKFSKVSHNDFIWSRNNPSFIPYLSIAPTCFSLHW